MAQIECIGPMKIGMKIRRDSIALAAEALSKMFDKGEEELVQQVRRNEPRHEKTNILHMRKQRRNREADQRLCFHYIDSTIPLLSKSKITSL